MGNEKARAKRLEDCFKLTVDKWNLVEAFQHKCCAVCGRPERRPNQRLATDHEWTTGIFRGLLCSQCNPLVGKLERAFIRLGMHKEGLSLKNIVAKIAEFLANPTATQALGYEHIGYPGDVSTKAHRKRIKKMKSESKAK
jgi:hypothetical protein